MHHDSKRRQFQSTHKTNRSLVRQCDTTLQTDTKNNDETCHIPKRLEVDIG